MGKYVYTDFSQMKAFFERIGVAADTGMALKQQWVEGAHYWESALRILERVYPALLDSKLQEWLDNYFGR